MHKCGLADPCLVMENSRAHKTHPQIAAGQVQGPMPPLPVHARFEGFGQGG